MLVRDSARDSVDSCLTVDAVRPSGSGLWPVRKKDEADENRVGEPCSPAASTLVNVSAVPINHFAPVSTRRATPYQHPRSRRLHFIWNFPSDTPRYSISELRRVFFTLEYFLLSILDFLQFSLLKSVLSYPQFSIPSQFQFSILDSTQFSILALFGFQFFSILRLSRKYLQKFPPINYIAPRYFASAWDPRSSRDSFDSRVKSCFTENRTSYETVVPAFAEQMVRGNTVYALDRERVPQVRQLPTFLPSSLSGRSVLTY